MINLSWYFSVTATVLSAEPVYEKHSVGLNEITFFFMH